MSILINSNTKVIVQGITGEQGSFHTKMMIADGTKIVAGVTPGKGGQHFRCGAKKIPVFDSVAEAVKNHPADFTISFVPAPHALSAATDALACGLHTVIITEHIPVHDAMAIMANARSKNLVVIGPNCPGIITPGECKIGIMQASIFKRGRIGVLSRSGTLTYEIVNELTRAGLGQSTVIGIGGDPVTGLSFIDGLSLFEKDHGTDAIVLIGEIGGDSEERAAAFMKKNITKPVVAYIAGKTAPSGKTMGHAGAIISGKSGAYASKIDALKKAGASLAELPWEVPALVKKLLPLKKRVRV
jgi:succinyl-CoA synthetase alpha subunit